METIQKNELSWIAVFCASCMPFATPPAGAQVGTGRFDIPTIVNVLGANDVDVDAVLAATNSIMLPANIQLVKHAVRTDVVIGNGDGRLTAIETGEAVEHGLSELSWPSGPGKGIFLYLLDDIVVGKSEVTSWADTFLPVFAVESAPDTDKMGRALAQELGRWSGLQDVEDTGNLMSSAGNGTALNPAQIDSMAPSARKIGSEYSELTSDAYVNKARAFAGDPPGDVILFGGPGRGPPVPTTSGPELLLFTVLVENPLDPDGIMNLEFVVDKLREPYADSFFDIFFALDGDTEGPGNGTSPNLANPWGDSDVQIGIAIPAFEYGGGAFPKITNLADGSYERPDWPVNVEDVGNRTRIQFGLPVALFNAYSSWPLNDALAARSPIYIVLNAQTYRFDPVTFASEGFSQDRMDVGRLALVVAVATSPDGSHANHEGAGSSLDPVSTFTGELFDNLPADLYLDGPMPLVFRRYYASMLKSDGNIAGSLGDNWLHNFDMTLSQSGTNITVINNQGRVIEFSKSNTTWELEGKTDIAFQLVKSGTDFILGEPRTGLMYTFESSGKLNKTEDGRGNTHTLAYDGAGQLTQVSDGLGRTLTFTYDGNGRLSTVSDGARTVAFGHRGNDLTSVADPRGDVTTYSYDGGGLMTAMIRSEGNSPYTQTFDTDGRVVSQSDADGNTHTFAYTSLTTAMTDPLGNPRIHTHTTNGELIAHKGEDEQTFTMGYDSNGRRNLITDRLGDATSYT